MLKVNLGPRWRSSWGTQGFDKGSLRSAAASQGHQARPGGGGSAATAASGERGREGVCARV